MNPTVDQALSQAIEAHKSGKLQDAERLYRAILATQPNHPDANHNLGVLAFAVGRSRDALPYLKAALEANPKQGAFWISYIGALIESGHLAEAGETLDQGKRSGLSGDPVEQLETKLGIARTRQPSQRQIDELLASYNAGDLQRAEQLAGDLTRRYPDHPFGWKVLGVCANQLGKLQASAAAMRKSIQFAPYDGEAHSNLGATLKSLGDLAEAETSLREAIRLSPLSSGAHSNLGDILNELGRPAESEVCCREAIRLKPDFAGAHYNLGNALRDLGRLADAAASYRAAILYSPGYAEACSNLGNCSRTLGNFIEARDCSQRAARLNPTIIEAHINLGVALTTLGRQTEAEASYREALRLRPDDAEAYSNLLFSQNYVESLPPEAILREAKLYGSMVSAKAMPKFTSWRIASEPDKLRIGFVSGDLRNHPVGYFIEGLIQHFDQSNFELYAFPTKAEADDLTDRIKPRLQEWVPVYGKNDLEAATAIHDRGIQVLIDLAGHTGDNRLPIFAFKPAPVQVSWLGYFATTGLPEMDYFLGDPHMSPPDEKHHFTETIWNLPETWLCLTPPGQPVPVSPLPALTNGYVTFGCLGNLSKMNDLVVGTWADILRGAPTSKLFLKSKQMADGKVIADVLNRFTGQGISADRLILAAPSSRAEYFESYNRVDMILDTFPYPGGTTSVDALWMGVPVLTLKGDRFLSRMGETIAMNADHANWIALDLPDYVSKAVAFAADLDSLANDRSALRDRILQTPLFDARRFAGNFEQALREMRNGRLPDARTRGLI